MGNEWFKTWFDTTYYHLLYRNRNEVEARQFIDALLRFLSPEPNARFIDVACGKGRHSTYLNSRGYDVTGIDLSENSIEEAKRREKEANHIRFYQHDIREPFPVQDIDVAVNLFTSFGYFNNDEEHLLALQNVYDCLKPGGVFVLDYLNTSEVIQSLRRTDKQRVDNVEFEIQRYVEEGSIVKSIEVIDQAELHHYEERVRAFSKDDLQRLLEQVSFEVEHVFGDYELHDYTDDSSRVVIIAKRKS